MQIHPVRALCALLLLCACGPVVAETIVGSWMLTGQNSRDEPAAVIVFLANGTYYQIQNASASEGPSGFDGFERGTYTWNADTGALTFVTQLDTNGDLGISAPGGAAGFRFLAAGDTGVVTVPDDSNGLLFSRITGFSPIVGGWALGDTSQADRSGIVVFLPNGVYLLGQDAEAGATDGIEHGTYSWDEASGQFTSSRSPAPFVDTQGDDWGLSALPAGTTATVSSNTLTLAASGETNQLARVGSSPSSGGEFKINAGLDDAWYNPDTAGQGFFITVFPEIGQIFLAWFTFDVQRPPGSVTAQLGDPGHRWLTAFGSYSGNQAELDIEITKGGIFDVSPPVPTQQADGTISLEFTDCNAGTVSYNIPSISKQGVVPIQRITLDNMLLCESLAAQAQ